MMSIRRDIPNIYFFPDNNAFQIIMHIENRVKYSQCLISDLPLYYIIIIQTHFMFIVSNVYSVL